MKKYTNEIVTHTSLPPYPFEHPWTTQKTHTHIVWKMMYEILFRCLKNCAKNYDMWRSKNILLLLLFIFYLFIILQRLEKSVDDNICLSLKIVQGVPTSLV